MTLNCSWLWSSNYGYQENVEYTFVAITPRFILTQRGSTCERPISGSNGYVWKLYVLNRETWRNLIIVQGNTFPNLLALSIFSRVIVCWFGFYGKSTLLGYLMPNLLYTRYIRFGSVLWYINLCRLFNAKSSLYIYIKHMFSKHILLINF